GASRLDRFDVVQPVLFSIQVAYARLWQACGVEPDAVVGHSMGEVAAAHVAGALSLRDAARIICARSQILSRIAGSGAMLLVGASPEEVGEILPSDGAVEIAAINGPRSVVLTGDAERIEPIARTLASRQIFCRPLRVGGAA